MKLVLSSLLTFGFLFSGCSAMVANKRTAADNAPAAVMQPTPAPSSYGGDQDKPQLAAAVAQPGQYRLEEPKRSEPPAPIVTDRKIIRNGEFTIETKNPIEDQRKLAAIAESLGGFVVTSEFQQSATQSTSTVEVIVRVPAANFQKATDEIRKTGLRVLHEKLSGKDVTEEFVDLEARLRAQKALEAQYLEIMKRASKISDVLEVQEKLTEVRTQIEQQEGRRRYLENQSALSTINISLQTPAPLVAATQTGFWASIKNSFGDGVDVTVTIVLGLIHFVIVALPIVVLLLLPAGLIARFLWKRVSWPKKASVGIVPPAE
jgi:hypothetical protein